MEYRCKYCNCKVPKYQKICMNCYQKLPLVRGCVEAGQELKRLVEEYKKRKAEKQ